MIPFGVQKGSTRGCFCQKKPATLKSGSHPHPSLDESVRHLIRMIYVSAAAILDQIPSTVSSALRSSIIFNNSSSRKCPPACESSYSGYRPRQQPSSHPSHRIRCPHPHRPAPLPNGAAGQKYFSGDNTTPAQPYSCATEAAANSFSADYHILLFDFKDCLSVHQGFEGQI